MANTKLDRIERDIEKTRAKILEQTIHDAWWDCNCSFAACPLLKF